MKERARYLLTGLLILAVGAGCYYLWVREPAYEGRSLSEWLEEAGNLQGGYAASRANAAAQRAWEVRHQEVSAAVRSMGPHALPYLLRWMRNAPRPSPTREKIQEWLDQQSWVKIHLPERRDRSDLAYFGFQVLGSNAIDAIPGLSRILAQRINPPAAAACLQVIGPAAYPALAQGLTNSDAEVHHLALFNLLEVARQLEPSVSRAVIDAITNGVVPLDELDVRYLGDSGPVLRGLAPWLASLMHTRTNPLAGVAAAHQYVRREPGAVRPIPERVPHQCRLCSTRSVRPGPSRSDRCSAAARSTDEPRCQDKRGGSGSPGSRAEDGAAWRLPAEPEHILRFSLQHVGWSGQVCPGAENGGCGGFAGVGNIAGLPGPGSPLADRAKARGYGVYGAPGLSRAAQDEDQTVRAAARAALGRLDVEVKDGTIIRGPRDLRQIALVFTGHEHGEGGQAILDELARHKAQASFFLTAGFLNQRALEPLIQRICTEGHCLGPHAGLDLRASAQAQPTLPGAIRERFEADFSSNLNGIGRWLQNRELPGYFLPCYERCDYDLVQWAGNYFYVTINPTPGILSGGDMTAGAEPNRPSRQSDPDRIIAWEQQDRHALNGCILSFDLDSNSGSPDDFPKRFGQLLDALAAKGYRFVSVDTMLDAQTAEQERQRRVVLRPPAPRPEVEKGFLKRYGLTNQQ